MYESDFVTMICDEPINEIAGVEVVENDKEGKIKIEIIPENKNKKIRKKAHKGVERDPSEKEKVCISKHEGYTKRRK
jgi:hypothetical protein